MDFTELACQWIDENINMVAIQPIDVASFKYILDDVRVIVKNDRNDGIVELPLKDHVKYTTLISKYSTLLKSFNVETLSLYNLLTTQYERDLYATKVESPQEFKLVCKDLIEDAVYVLEYEIPYTLLMKVINSDIDAYLELVDFDLLFKAIY